ncbi:MULTISPECIES: hypothetical protein [Pseudofrankia]|uniref:hypothetical protein n=1 Tax=Pseudofrankia TaxID=2994363 RepID=UPI000234C523|nr:MULTISPECIES: hypothetical protein [Pseudofrankia]OHV27516.1 hypothetical protein BCD49_38730 [Pseudofrankia sp. EUN1h]
MEPVWNGMLTCDYERTRPQATPFEWDLYTRSLTRWPLILMNDPESYGRLRRSGIVDIPELVHHTITGRWHARLRNLDYVADLISRTVADRRAVALVLDACDAARRENDLAGLTAALATATTAFLRVNATHVVNWLLPEDRWERLLIDLLGSRESALTCLSALQLPTEPGHILATATAETDVLARRASAAARREAWTAAALVAAAGNDPTLTEVRALAAVLGWAADSEERRKELRERLLATARAWCEVTNANPDRITIEDLLGEDHHGPHQDDQPSGRV